MIPKITKLTYLYILINYCHVMFLNDLIKKRNEKDIRREILYGMT